MLTCGFDRLRSTTEYTSLQSLISILQFSQFSNYYLPITTHLNSAPEYPNICLATTRRLICPVPS